MSSTTPVPSTQPQLAATMEEHEISEVEIISSIRDLPRHPLGHIAHPVAVVTASHGGQDVGLTVGWVSMVNTTPSTLMISISPERFSHASINNARTFGISFLARDQLDIGRVFGFKSCRDVNKFELVQQKGFRTFRGKDVPALLFEGSVMCCECRIVKPPVDLEDHTVFFGQMVRVYYGKDVRESPHSTGVLME